MAFDPAELDLTRAEAVRDLFLAGAEANRCALCRQGSIDRITPPGTLIATGDLHDNPVNFGRLLKVSGLDTGTTPPGLSPPTHLLLHEIIHSDRLVNGMDFSFRALARVAALKAVYPERVHTLLANHELAQIIGAGIVKDGVKVVEAFNEGLNFAFGDDAPMVNESIIAFVKSMPLALRCVGARRDILCAHSLPGIGMMGRFDPGILTRELTEDDYVPRTGSAHQMVWGRGYDAEQIEDFVERWGVSLIILGHEKAEHGVKLVPPSVVVLNTDTERGVYLPIDLEHPPTAEEAVGMVKGLGEIE